MLTQDQKKYLLTIPENQKLKYGHYDPKSTQIASDFIDNIKDVLPEADVRFMGASALRISGQGDIDIYIFANPKKFAAYLPILKKVLGKPIHNSSLIEWQFSRNNHDITIYLDDPDKPTTQSQIKIFEALKRDKSLLAEYEKLKNKASKLSMREYQKSKYEFYNKILNI